jgi:aspartate/tyrosine/aromatic aminotransferase
LALKEHAQKGGTSVVILDLAYAHFTDREQPLDFLPKFLEKLGETLGINVQVYLANTLSKTAGMYGLRAGHLTVILPRDKTGSKQWYQHGQKLMDIHAGTQRGSNGNANTLSLNLSQRLLANPNTVQELVRFRRAALADLMKRRDMALGALTAQSANHGLTLAANQANPKMYEFSNQKGEVLARTIRPDSPYFQPILFDTKDAANSAMQYCEEQGLFIPLLGRTARLALCSIAKEVYNPVT